MPHRQVDQLLGPFAGAAAAGKIVRPVGIDHDAQAWLRYFDRRQIDFALGERQDAEAQRHGFGAQQRWISRGFVAVQHKRSHARRQCRPAEGKAPDFDASPGGMLDLGDDPPPDILVEPSALHHHQTGQRGDRQQHGAGGDHPQHHPAENPPPRLPHANTLTEKPPLYSRRASPCGPFPAIGPAL